MKGAHSHIWADACLQVAIPEQEKHLLYVLIRVKVDIPGDH
jgi:hypothetical protein